jgi:hypothetical protein
MNQDELLQWFSQDRRKSNRECAWLTLDGKRWSDDPSHEGDDEVRWGQQAYKRPDVVGLFEAKGLDVWSRPVERVPSPGPLHERAVWSAIQGTDMSAVGRLVRVTLVNGSQAECFVGLPLERLWYVKLGGKAWGWIYTEAIWGVEVLEEIEHNADGLKIAANWKAMLPGPLMAKCNIKGTAPQVAPPAPKAPSPAASAPTPAAPKAPAPKAAELGPLGDEHKIPGKLDVTLKITQLPQVQLIEGASSVSPSSARGARSRSRSSPRSSPSSKRLKSSGRCGREPSQVKWASSPPRASPCSTPTSKSSSAKPKTPSPRPPLP